MSHSDCQILFEAGKALVEKSGLVHYHGQHFVGSDDKARFDRYWKEQFHSEFGRYMAWVLFSVGAENLAKAACVCNGVVKVDHRPTLGNYVNKHFKKLCRGTGIAAPYIQSAAMVANPAHIVPGDLSIYWYIVPSV